MKNNDLKMEKLIKQMGVGSWITIGHPSIAEIMSDAGFDWLCIDMEHTVIDYAQAQNLISVIQGKGKIAYVRVGENNPRIIKRVLDAGADGIIVPMVNSIEDAQNAVNAVRYPPEGKRGVGLARAQGYGFSFDEYLKKQKNLDIIVQIEHIDAIKNLKSILSINGVSGSIIGPYDLSASMGKPGKYEDDDVKEMLAEYEKLSLELKMPMGYHIVEPDSNKFLEMQKKGYTILALSFDAMFLGSICRKQLDIIKGKSK
jgi:2-keto-3-deoxy-L-rhamnonate aldolase RhmA